MRTKSRRSRAIRISSKNSPPREGWVVEVRGYTYHEKADTFVRWTFIENLKEPRQFKKDGKELMTDEMRELVRSGELFKENDKKKLENRVEYLHVYKIKTNPDPVAGQYTYIGKSYLKTLVKGEAAKVGANQQGAVRLGSRR